MFPEFRRRFPRAALISKLLHIDHGKYIVLVRVESEGRILATGLAAADTIETAEDRARERAIALLTGESEEIAPVPESRELVISSPMPEIVSSIAPVEEIAKPARKEPEKDPPKETITPLEETPLPEVPTPEPIPAATPKKATKTPKNPPVAPPEPPPVVKMPEPEPELDSFAPEMEEDNYSLYPDNGLRAIEEEPEPPAPLIPLPVEEIDYSVLKTKIDVEMKRLGWTMEKGRDYLISTYGKKSRLLLTNEELLEFYNHLSSI
jgi:hypothetical protein